MEGCLATHDIGGMAYDPEIASQYRPIGILGGSSAEAALALAQQILIHARALLPIGSRTDQSAPRILLLSDPRLGASMDIARHERYVRRVVIEGLEFLCSKCAHVAIACNTLNFFGQDPEIAERFSNVVWFQDVLGRLIDNDHHKEFTMYGIRSVVAYPYSHSPYRLVLDQNDHRISTVDVTELVERVKTGEHSATKAYLKQRLRDDPRTAIIACTDLSFLNVDARNSPDYIDLVQAVSETLASKAKVDWMCANGAALASDKP